MLYSSVYTHVPGTMVSLMQGSMVFALRSPTGRSPLAPRAASSQRRVVFPSPRSHAPAFLGVDGDVLCGPCSSPPPDCLYGRQSHTLHRTRLHLPGSPLAFFFDPLPQLGR